MSMLEVVCSSGVDGLKGCLGPNCEPNDNDGRRDLLGVGSLGLALLGLETYYEGNRSPGIKIEIGGHVSR